MSEETDIQHLAEVHLERCLLALDAEEQGETPSWPDVAGPFCGCTTCIVREVLNVTYDAVVLLAMQVRSASN